MTSSWNWVQSGCFAKLNAEGTAPSGYKASMLFPEAKWAASGALLPKLQTWANSLGRPAVFDKAHFAVATGPKEEHDFELGTNFHPYNSRSKYGIWLGIIAQHHSTNLLKEQRQQVYNKYLGVLQEAIHELSWQPPDGQSWPIWAWIPTSDANGRVFTEQEYTDWIVDMFWRGHAAASTLDW